ncbi:dihydroneopterin aldolase [Parasediminibacterium sp. JCM 36343]|uniref:dihydroneopterin aldolase n=1 Tax=Parasediminibacterium sp. JCM 36343 TaxID=3374279 RepID=UPI00397D7D18
MLSIHLNNLTFFAYHGLYEEEKVLGNIFIVNATVSYHPSHQILDITDTIDYVSIYELIKQRMEMATPLLETVVMEMAQAILKNFPLAEEVSIELTKQKPPIPNFEGSVGVSFKLKR